MDDNHRELVRTFRQLGYTVLDLSAVGKGCPDLLVAKGGVNILIEIKDGAKSPSRRQLTPDQKAFHARWMGRIEIIESTNDVVAMDYYRWKGAK